MRTFLAGSMLLIAGAAHALQAAAKPDSVVLGVETHVAIRVTGIPNGATVQTYASQGELKLTGSVSAQEAVFEWTPPGVHIPQTALLAFWTMSGGTPEVAAVAIPLLGRTDLEADTEPGASVVVEVSGKRFGPVRASKRGKASIPIEVPPNATSAKVIADVESQHTERSTPLDVPATSPVAATFVENPVKARESSWLIVLEGESVTASSVGVEFAQATSALKSQGPHWQLYRVVADGAAKRVEARVNVQNRPEARAEAHADVLAGAPEPPAPVAPPRHWYPQAQLGAFYGGGSNGGIGAAAGVGYELPFKRVPTAVELDVGIRSTGSTVTVSGTGSVDNSLTAVPFELAVRPRLFSHDPFALDVRLGGGMAAFWLTESSLTRQSKSSSGAVPELFGGVEGAAALGALELFLQVRAAWTPSVTSDFSLPLSGVYVFVGGRYLDR